MTTRLHIAAGLDLPLDAVTETFGIVGQKGAGKTFTAKVLAEELARALQPVCVLDPLGVWWGLRSSADGKGPGKPFVILGGDHADVPLEPTGGEVAADFVVDEPAWTIIDLSHFRKAEMRRFVTAFLSRLYHRNRDPLHLIVDEADLFAPQRPAKDETTLLGAMEDIVRRGRAKGIGITMVTQRPAVIHKDVLTQISTLVTLRMVGPQDRKAIDGWVEAHGTSEERRQVMDSLASLPTGTAWFWSPSWLGVFAKVKVRAITTFDSSATPKGGRRPSEPRVMAPVDLSELKERMADTIEKVKATDPVALNRRIAELERQLRNRPTEKVVEIETQTVEVPLVDEATLLRLEELLSQPATLLGEVQELLLKHRMAVERGLYNAGTMRLMADVLAAKPAPEARNPRPSGGLGTTTRTRSTRKVPAPRAILIALAQYPEGISQHRAAILAGLSPKKSTVRNALSELRGGGLVEGVADHLQITRAGITELGDDYEPLPSGPALLDYWLGQVGGAERAILAAVVDAFPAAPSKEELAAATGVDAEKSTMRNALSRLRGLGLVTGMRASDDLMAAIA